MCIRDSRQPAWQSPSTPPPRRSVAGAAVGNVVRRAWVPGGEGCRRAVAAVDRWQLQSSPCSCRQSARRLGGCPRMPP
eukprot:15389763-Alexandrium_andersonii.AAC.1